MVPLDFFNLSDCFDIKTNGRVNCGLFDVNPIFMDAFDDDFFEQAVSVWTKHHDLIELDDSSRYHTSKDQTDTFGLIAGVNNKLVLDLRVGVVDWLGDLFFLNFRHLRRGKNTHELS